MATSEQGRKVWKSKGGASLFRATMGKEPMTPEGQEALDKLSALNEPKLGENWARPRGMHATTYERLLQTIRLCEQLRDLEIARFLLRHGADLRLDQ